MEIKIIIDFDRDPNLYRDAKQVVYLNGVYNPVDPDNLIGKYITKVEVHESSKCLILTLDEELPPLPEEPKNE